MRSFEHGSFVQVVDGHATIMDSPFDLSSCDLTNAFKLRNKNVVILTNEAFGTQARHGMHTRSACLKTQLILNHANF